MTADGTYYQKPSKRPYSYVRKGIFQRQDRSDNRSIVGYRPALAYEFAANGANVVIGARHDTKLAEIAGDLTNRGAAVACVPPMSPARRIAAAW